MPDKQSLIIAASLFVFAAGIAVQLTDDAPVLGQATGGVAYDLSVQIAPERFDVRTGETVNIMLVFRNNGPSPAAQASAAMYGDSRLALLSVSDPRCQTIAPMGSMHPLEKLRCTLDLAPNSQARMTVVARVGNDPGSCGAKDLRYTVFLTAEINTSPRDPRETNPVNNRADTGIQQICGDARSSFGSSSSAPPLVDGASCGTFSQRSSPDGRIVAGMFTMRNTGQTTWALAQHYFRVKIGSGPWIPQAVTPAVRPGFNYTASLQLQPLNRNHGCTPVGNGLHTCPVEWAMFQGLGATAPFGETCRGTMTIRFGPAPPASASSAAASSSGFGTACSDSDGGVRIRESGRVTVTGLSFEDVCLQRSIANGRARTNLVRTCRGSNCYIREGSCRQNRYAVSTARCSRGCESGVCL
ncbi:hypothetical protein HYZ99_00020 [Candidatus Peregrinibacteria bacterium]|nr:hypothetical protein [Candidatus Peregrinibacteria bacterium]